MNEIPAFYFDHEKLLQTAHQLTESFLKASPFPHIVIDGFIPEKVAQLLADEFPEPDDIAWTLWGPGATAHTKDKRIEKIGASDENLFRPFTRHFMMLLNSFTFLQFTEILTGIQGLLPDPSFTGGGMHSTGKGGRLLVHADASRHPNRQLHQRLNLILFLNRDWKEEYGGHLELWSQDRSHCEKKILPVFNRCVIFDTGTSSYHGHPEPLTCPQDRRRNSLAVYYYVTRRPTDKNYEGLRDYVDWILVKPQDKFRMEIFKTAQKVKKFVPRPWINFLKRFIKI